MAKLKMITRAGETVELEDRPGFSVMELVTGSGSEELLAICGGALSCATCHVYVDEAFLGTFAPPNLEEQELLETVDHRRPNSRLSCQLPFGEAQDGLTIVIPPED